MIAAVKSHNPIRAALETAGIRLVRDKGLCPFHNDKTPSLSIKGERWRCWGCGSCGDVIDFTAKYYGLDMRGAIRFLADRAGIKPVNTQADRSRIAAEKAHREKKQELLRAFRKWEQTTVNEIAEVLRRYHRMRTVRTAYTEAELIDLAELQGNIDILEYQYGILAGRDDHAKVGLYKEMEHGDY